MMVAQAFSKIGQAMVIGRSLLRHVIYPSFARAGVFRRFRERQKGGYLTVLTYHGILPTGYEQKDPWLDGNLIDANMFKQQMALLKAKYRVLDPDQLRAYLASGDPFPRNSILLTCDDGLKNNLTEMVPLLREAKLRCMFFVTTESLNRNSGILWHEELYLTLRLQSNGLVSCDGRSRAEKTRRTAATSSKATWCKWVEELSRVDLVGRREFLEECRKKAGVGECWDDYFDCDMKTKERFMLLSRKDLTEMVHEGMPLGSHGCTHPLLTVLPDDAANWEIEDSRRRLGNELGVDVWAFSYPFGDGTSFSGREERFAERSGYECAFANFGGLVPPRLRGAFRLARVNVTNDLTLAEFEARVSGFHGMLREKLGLREMS